MLEVLIGGINWSGSLLKRNGDVDAFFDAKMKFVGRYILV